VRKERIAYWKQTHVDKILPRRGHAGRRSRCRRARGRRRVRRRDRAAHAAARGASRADLDRERAVQVLELRQLAPDKLEVRVLCQHGTYVKEWISGDEARTTPSLASLLGVGCTCTLLDVEEVLTDDIPGPRLVPATAPAREQP